jgi:fatty-acyl-CoA synthase
VREHLVPLVARWWIPDQVVFVEEIPKTATGKFSKRELRSWYWRDAGTGPEHDAGSASTAATKE